MAKRGNRPHGLSVPRTTVRRTQHGVKETIHSTFAALKEKNHSRANTAAKQLSKGVTDIIRKKLTSTLGKLKEGNKNRPRIMGRPYKLGQAAHHGKKKSPDLRKMVEQAKQKIPTMQQHPCVVGWEKWYRPPKQTPSFDISNMTLNELKRKIGTGRKPK